MSLLRDSSGLGLVWIRGLCEAYVTLECNLPLVAEADYFLCERCFFGCGAVTNITAVDYVSVWPKVDTVSMYD